jgi:RHS repeat-associated protein
MEKGSTVYNFTYDPAGRPVSISDGNTRYYYVLNQQGDVIGLLNSNEELIVMYVYDAWGRVLASADLTASGIGTNNPLRYRGYVYDTETGLYYLRSRYYNPTWGRFINADNNFSYLNLFAYCANNPVNATDPNGEHWYFLWIDDLFEAVDELMASVSNITFGREASKRAVYDPKGAQELYNSRPFQDVKPSKEMQAFTEFMYDTNFVFDLSISISTPLKNTYIKVGASKVTSPNKNLNASYVHLGGGKATASVFPVSITYSAGFARGVNQKKDYAKHFLDSGAGAIFGVDYCFWPNGASAYCFTIGTSYGGYVGYDYYWCIN